MACEYVTSFYVEFEPVSREVINSFREKFFEWLDDEGLDLVEFSVGYQNSRQKEIKFDQI